MSTAAQISANPTAASARDLALTVSRNNYRTLLLSWAIVRLPLLLGVLYLVRHPLMNLIEKRFDIIHVTHFAIDLLSTPVARIIYFGALLIVLLAIVALSIKRLRPLIAYAVMLAAAGIVIAASFELTDTPLQRGALVGLIFASNLAPAVLINLLKRIKPLWSAIMIAGVAIVELLLLQQYWQWLRGKLSHPSGDAVSAERWTIASTLPGIVLTALACTMLLRGPKLAPFEQMLRMSSQVTLLERTNFNWIELDATGAHLYVTGHEIPNLRRHTVADMTAPAVLSDVTTGGAQDFTYDPRANEIYAYDIFAQNLLYFDANTLKHKRTIHLPHVSPGDPWLAVDPLTDTITIVSEADEKTGVPFMVLNRTTGEVLAQSDLDAGNVLMHPTKPWLYLSFFRRGNEVMLYDLEQLKITRTGPADERAERMAFNAATNELFVTSPMESRIMRFDADTLRPKGHINSLFGVRAIAIDPKRNLLLTGSLATGYVNVIDLGTGKERARYYLGPWLRTICVHAESGTAFVSSNGAMYHLDYTAD